MPTYEYRCADCGHHFDIVQAFTDDALTECPECGGRLKKVFGSVGIAFKGSGFYVNDSAGRKVSTSAPAGDADSTRTGEDTKSGNGSSAGTESASTTSKGSDAKPKSKAKAKSKAAAATD